MSKNKYPQPKQRKLWEKRNFDNLKVGGRPMDSDFPGTKAAYAWAKKRGFRVSVEKRGPGYYYIWRVK